LLSKTSRAAPLNCFKLSRLAAPGVPAMHELPTGVPIYGYIYVKPDRLVEVPAATEAGKA
jgi:hypothetical protein